MYFRNTKDRKNQSQTYLKIKSGNISVPHESEDIYEHTYGVRLPDSSHDILSPCIAGLTMDMCAPDMNERVVHTVGVWVSPTGDVCRCTFVQPEIASATCNISASKSHAAIMAKKVVLQQIPWAEECRITSEPNVVRSTGGIQPRTPQISGRMAPYVVQEAGISNACTWGFANLCKTRLIFTLTSTTEQLHLCPTRLSMMILKQYMPKYAACIYDDDMSCYMITVTPDIGGDASSANKHTSLVIYGDGAIKVQGTPSKMRRVCYGMSEAIHSIAKSRSWERFLTSMSKVEVIINRKQKEDCSLTYTSQTS